MDANNFHMWYIQVHGQKVLIKETREWSTTAWIGQFAGRYSPLRSFSSYANIRIMVF